ncbi:MAG: protein adenylyltransferase SelO family protein [Pseudohongiellaceae bacterium]
MHTTAVLAQALLPLLHSDQEQAVALAQDAVDTFPTLFEAAHLQGLADKLGLAEVGAEDKPLVDELFELMAAANSDFTLTFRRLYDHANEPEHQVGEWFELPDSLLPWLARWRKRLAADFLTAQTREQRMRQANPALIPRNHKVEEAIRAAEDEGDFSPFHGLLEQLASPSIRRLILRFPAPRPEEEVRRTLRNLKNGAAAFLQPLLLKLAAQRLPPNTKTEIQTWQDILN